MSAHVMIILVGGRQAPNVIGVTSFRPDMVAAVVSEDEKSTWEKLCATLDALPKVELERVPHVVPAFDMTATRTACDAIVSAHKGARFSFNLTGATKLMSFGAYEAAKAAVVAGTEATAFYLDTAGGQCITLVGKPMPSKLRVPQSVVEYLRAYGRQGRPGAHAAAKVTGGEETAVRVAHALACGTDPAFEPRTHADCAYVERGGWLEVYVYAVARELAQGERRLFSDVRLGLRIPTGDGAENEIDVIALYHGQVLVCSCKTGAEALKEVAHLDQLRTVAALIGGRYCTSIYITDQPGGRRDKGFFKQAQSRQIVVVCREDLPGLGAILMREAQRSSYPRL